MTPVKGPLEIGRMMDALDAWEGALPSNWAVRPKGTVFPYFCSVMKGDGTRVKVRFLMLEGWQTFHDFVRTRQDRFFGFYSTPMELPHYELVAFPDGVVNVFRHDPGYVPRQLRPEEEGLVAKILWESYGVLMRIESEPRLALRYADSNAMFSRHETAPGEWADAPLPIAAPAVYVERISFPKDDIARAKDLPFATDEAWEVDFRFLPSLVTQEPRPRCAYALVAVDAKTGERIVSDRVSVSRDGGLKALWESMPSRLLKHILARGRFPGEIRLVSGRVFRMVRPLCQQIPFKLSMHDSLPRLEAAFRR